MSIMKYKIIALSALSLMLVTASVAPAQAKSKGSFVPGLSITPSVFEPDGHTLRTYQTATGQSYWSPELPVRQGDKVVLNVFVTTGGAELGKLIVRLDNVKFAEVSSAPWNTVIDTAPLSQGPHMVEVWAQAGSTPSQASTKTLSFVVASAPTPVRTISTEGSSVIEPDGAFGSSNSDTPTTPTLKFLSGKTVNPDAGLAMRSQDPEIDRLLTTDNGSVMITSPAVIYCERSPGSQAVSYGYALVRNDKSIVASTKAGSLEYVKIRIQPRGDGPTGLLPGKVSLWVWGIDRTGHPSNPIHRDFVIASTGQ